MKIVVFAEQKNIEGYDPEHRLITVGEDDETLGVYSLEQKRMIIYRESIEKFRSLF